uniref:Putative cuticle protein n=1 Tax=Bombyx mori TaxID=7091 RepID=C0H6F6_BOMMO|nr:cuticular protein glycine-rich 29 precursor [Bombyx mori]FAA00467.1 TPA: putative cuticle protein [Bombyx mori]
MSHLRLILLWIIGVLSWTAVQGEPSEVQSKTDLLREPRSFHTQKLCQKLGLCQEYGGYQGHQGYGGYQEGYGGHQGGYPINIAISQSQSSANEGGGYNRHGYYPNNYQYNGHPNRFGNQGHGYRPGYFGNGYGSYNNQFNGNYYGGNGGYRFRPYSGYYDEDYNDSHEDDSYERSSGTLKVSAHAVAEAKK